MIEPLTDARYERRKQRLIARLDRLGDLDIEEAEAPATRKVQLVVTAPGHALPVTATFDYVERFVRDGSFWRITGYRYEYREAPPPGRIAYHWHDERFHAHCVERGRAVADHHYRAHEVTVFEAHDEFTRLYTQGEPVGCGHLRPAIPSH